METLRTYLNSLPVDEQAAYAESCDTTIGYLRKALSTKAQMDGALCRKLDENSNGKVPRSALRPDIWPEQRKAA
jgi:hypothetical protein